MTALEDVFNDTNQVYRLTVEGLIYQSQTFGDALVRLVISSNQGGRPLAVIAALTGETRDLERFIKLLDQFESETYE